MDTSGIQLSLMEGMDEALLLAMHRQGILTRDDFLAQSRTRQDRETMAQSLNVPYSRIEGIHHLNCVTPVDRAARLFQLESDMELMTELIESHHKRIRSFHRWLIGAMTVCVGAAALGIAIPKLESKLGAGTTPSAASSRSSGAVLSRPDKQQLVEPASFSHAAPAQDPTPPAQDPPPPTRPWTEADVLAGLASMGPAPGWTPGRPWPGEGIAAPAGDSLEGPGAVAGALALLAEAQSAGLANLSFEAAARRAQEELAALPFPRGNNSWDQAGAAVWVRLLGRTCGLEPAPEVTLGDVPDLEGNWGSRGFLQAERRLASLESQPINDAGFEAWAAGVKKLHHAVNVGRDQLHPHPNAWAREYWLVRARMELTVVAAMLGRSTLAPYNRKSPESYASELDSYLKRARATAPDEAKYALTWLQLELQEAQRLVGWLASDASIRALAEDRSWAGAIQSLETARGERYSPLSPEMQDILSSVGSMAGDAAQADLKYEAHLRPLLLDTRASLRAPGPAAGAVARR